MNPILGGWLLRTPSVVNQRQNKRLKQVRFLEDGLEMFNYLTKDSKWWQVLYFWTVMLCLIPVLLVAYMSEQLKKG